MTAIQAMKKTDLPVEWVTPEAVARLVGKARQMGITIDDKGDRMS